MADRQTSDPRRDGERRQPSREVGERRQIPREDGERRQMPRESGERRQMSREGGERRQIPREGGERRQIPRESSERRQIPRESSERRQAPSRRKDVIRAPRPGRRGGQAGGQHPRGRLRPARQPHSGGMAGHLTGFDYQRPVYCLPLYRLPPLWRRNKAGRHLIRQQPGQCQLQPEQREPERARRSGCEHSGARSRTRCQHPGARSAPPPTHP